MSSAYACLDRPEKPEPYIAGNGYSPIEFQNWGNVTRQQEWTMVEHAMSTDCKYTVSQPHDPRCAGCRWQSASPGPVPGADSLGPLTARAQVGNTVYEVGVDARLVIDQAQRVGAAPTKRGDQ